MSVNNICFVSNYSKTWLFDGIAQYLPNSEYQSFWITVNDRIYDELLKRYPADSILHLNKTFADIPSEKIGEYKLNELIYGDRALMHTPEEGIRYLVNIQKPIYDFLAKNRISHLFGEITWAHEILIQRIVEQKQELGCIYLKPEVVRIPNGRFAFFLGEEQDRIVEITHRRDQAVLLQREIVVEKPDYLEINDAIMQKRGTVRGRLAKLKRFFTRENILETDPTHIDNNWKRLSVRAKEEMNRESYRLLQRTPMEEIEKHPFVFLALHKQPESSVDVLGRYYDDQYQNILNIWRVLPDDWLLVIKEHTNALGDRGIDFYKGLLRYPGIVLVNEKADSHSLIRHCRLVVTVSGTVAYEAALLKKPAITFASMYFNRIPHCRHVTLTDLQRCTSIHELIPQQIGDTGQFERYILENSFEGNVIDPVTSPNSLEPANLKKLAAAVQSVILSTSLVSGNILTTK